MLNNIKSSLFIFLHYKSKKKNFLKAKKNVEKYAMFVEQDITEQGFDWVCFFLSRMQNLPKRQKKRVNLWGQLAFLWPGQLTVC